MCIVGYDMNKKHFIIRNSWGKHWSNNGYCYYPFDEWGSHYEIWTTVDDETHIEKLDDPPTKCLSCVIN